SPLPQARSQRSRAAELLLELAGAKVLADVLEFLDIGGQGAVYVIGIGSQDIPPEVVGAEGQAGAVEEAGPGPLEGPGRRRTLPDGGGEGCGRQLRQVRGQRDGAVVLVGI